MISSSCTCRTRRALRPAWRSAWSTRTIAILIRSAAVPWIGAFIAALIWFPLVGYGAALLRKPLSRPHVWRWLNIGIGVVMCGLALKLILM